jgi:hypothetical protein
VPGEGVRSARERAAAAKEREIDAHRRAISFHESAATTFDRLGDAERAAHERELVQTVRERLALAIAEAERDA